MLDSYTSALLKGWSSNNVTDVSQQELLEINADPDAFVASRRDDAPIEGGTIELQDGSKVDRLPMRLRWIWDGDFCGQIGLRWQPGTDVLPEHVLGHIGYGVVPWKRGHGLAKRALRHMLGEARDVGLKRLQITTGPINFASQKVILANGGRFDGGFVSHHHDGSAQFRYIIDLA